MEPIANPWTAKILAALQRSVEAIIEVGQLLARAKGDLPHGEFQRMIEKDLPFTPRQARVYMRVAADPRLANRKHASVLPAAVNTLEVFSRLSDQEFERRLQSGDVHPNMSRKDALTLLKGEQTRLFEDEEFALSATGRDLERLIEEEGHAPRS